MRIDDETLRRAVADGQTVNAKGESLAVNIDGVKFRDTVTHADERGSVVEIYDPRWNWHRDPLVFVYAFSIRPGIAKGWNLHKLHEDRYCILQGEMEVVLYDIRPDSPTFKKVQRIVLSEHRRRLVNIPAYVWHADHNIGTKDVLVVNCPTMAYDHAKPDKYRLPLDTDLIPHKFRDAKGW
jgi:dTDP-4-dehydrorhamnose 3,5-epimerase